MYYVYVLKSEMDGMFYTGFTADLKRRLSEHKSGQSISTSLRRPFKLIYYEVCFDRDDALRREKYLKSGNGKIYLYKRLFNYLAHTKLIDLRNIDSDFETDSIIELK